MILTSVPKDFHIKQDYWKQQLKSFLSNKTTNRSLYLPSKLEYKPIDKNRLKIKPYVIGIDTETYETNGNLICLCNSETTDVLHGTVEEQPTIEDYFFYLDNLQKGKIGVIFFAYNLKFDASILLKTLKLDLVKFYEEDFVYNKDGLKVKYLNKKCLQLTKNKRSVMIFDALQYFLGAGIDDKGKPSSKLDNVAKAYLGEQKEYTGKYKNKRFPDKISDLEMELIINYCKLDCILVKKLMDIWIDSFCKNFDFYPDKYYSSGYLTVQLYKTKLDTFPAFRTIPFPVQELAYQSYFGGKFEIMKKGFMENIHHYDIKSAYPDAMSKMPDFLKGKWVKVTDKKDYEKDLVGFYKIHVDVKNRNITPFLLRNNYGQILTPQGEFITHTTGMELDKAFEYYDFELKKICGYKFIPSYKEKTPFNNLIEEMYETRMKQTNEGQKYVYKIILNAGYGKTAQSKPEPKGIFSPVVCSYITGHCRAKLIDIAKDVKDDIIMFATDGIFSRKKLNVKIGKKLGEFDYEFHPKFILLMAGVYSFNTQKDSEMNTRSRGFSLKVFDSEGNEQKFNLENYKLIRKDDKFYYQIKNMRPVALTTAVIQNKYTYKDVGKMEFITKEIDINGDKKRMWFKDLNSIYDFSESEAVKII